MKKNVLISTVSVLSALWLALSAPVAQAAAPNLDKGKAAFATCAACHGADGNSSIATYPSLAQQHPEYLIKQMKEFKSGARTGTVMNGMVAPLSEEDMRNIAYWVSANQAELRQATSRESVALGDKIWRGGIASRGVPACAACHGPNGAGIPAQYPRLSGQHAEYIEQQLKEFRDGVRTNDKVMPGVVNGMNDAQIKAVADFIQGLR